MRLALFILLFASLILEVSLTTVPLILLILNIFLVIYKRIEIVIFAFVFGIILDILSFNEVGISSVFFVIFLFLVLLYQGKFEIKTYSFVFLSTFLGSLLYLFVINLRPFLLESFASSLIALFLFVLLQKRLNYG